MMRSRLTILFLMLMLATTFGSSLYQNPALLSSSGEILHIGTVAQTSGKYYFEVGYGEVEKNFLGILCYGYSLTEDLHFIVYKIADTKTTYGLELTISVFPTDKFSLSLNAGLRSKIDDNSAFGFYIRDLTILSMNLDEFKIPDATFEFERFFNKNVGLSFYISYLKNSLFEFGGKLLFGDFGIIKYPYIGFSNFYNPTTSKLVFGFVLGTKFSFENVLLNGNLFWNPDVDSASTVEELKSDFVINLTCDFKF